MVAGSAFGADRQGTSLERVTRRAKIVCTLGPAVASPERIRALVDAGMDVARLNFSHGSYEDHEKVFHLVRAAAEEMGSALCMD